MSENFIDRLEELADQYRIEMDHLPTADQILSGLTYPKEEDFTDFSQKFILLADCNQELLNIYQKYGAKYNSLIEEKIGHYLDFLETLPIELQILTFKILMSIHKIPIQSHPRFEKIINELKQYIPV